MDKGGGKAVADVGAFVLNVFSSVFIIFTNKRLMGKPPNEDFRFGKEEGWCIYTDPKL